MSGITRLGLVACISLLSGAALAQPLVYNLPAQVTPMFDDLEAGGVGRMAAVGDSIVFRNPWHLHLRDELGLEYGYGGYGYRAANIDFRWLTELRVIYAGSSTNIVKARSNGKRDPVWGVYTPDGIYTRLRLDGSVSLVLQGSRYILHYLKQPGGGILAIDRNTTRLMNLDTNGPTGDATVELPVGPGKYRFSSTGSAWVQVNGVEVLSDKGFVIDRLARGGDGPLDYILANTTSTASVYAGLDADVLWVQFDWVGSQQKKTYITDMNKYLDFVEASNPGMRIILCSHHDMRPDIADEARWLYEIAVSRGLGFVNHFPVMTHEELVAAGYLTDDGIHLTDAGGVFFAHYDAERLRFAYRCMADWNQDGVLDPADLASFGADWSAGHADCNGDGVTDQADADRFNQAYSAGC